MDAGAPPPGDRLLVAFNTVRPCGTHTAATCNLADVMRAGVAHLSTSWGHVGGACYAPSSSMPCIVAGEVGERTCS
eukprot:gene41777-46712_t